MLLELPRSDVSLAELLRQPAPVDPGPCVCRECGHRGALIDNVCFRCAGFDVKGR